MLTPEYLTAFSNGYLGMVDNLNEQIVRDIARRMVKTGKVTDTAKWQIKQAQESGKLFSNGYLGMVDNLNEQIVRDIARRMVKTGKVTDTAKWQIKQAQESGKLLNDIVKEVGKFSGFSDKEILEMFKDAGITSIRNDGKPLLDAGVISEVNLSQRMQELLLANAKKTSGDVNNLTLTTAAKSQELYIQSLNEALLKVQSGAFSYQEALANAKKTSGDVNNLTLTTAAKSQELYIQSLNEALLKVQSGAFSYQEALKQAIRKAALSGGCVLYSSGSQMSLDAAMRMALLTGINQTAATLTEMYASDMGAEYYETTAHPGARLEHTAWQGQVFKIEGEGNGCRNFYEATGYGTVTGLCGANCRHSFHPFWPGISKPAYTKEMLNGYTEAKYKFNGDWLTTVTGLCGANCRHSFHPFWPGISKPAYTKEMLNGYTEAKYKFNGDWLTDYECSQIMRRYERQIRESKRILTAYDSAIKAAIDAETENLLKEEFQKESVKLKSKEKRLKDFCSETGHRIDTSRTQVYAVKDQNGNIVNYGRSTSMKAVWANRKAKK